jgi:hypothetical protein
MVPGTMGPTTKPTTTTTTTTATSSTKKIKDKGHDNEARQKLLEKALIEGRAEAKHEFDLQRTSIYETLSNSYQQMFGQIVFAKWKSKYLPALILSPYQVPPGGVRNMWMEKYEKVKIVVVWINIYVRLSSIHLF